MRPTDSSHQIKGQVGTHRELHLLDDVTGDDFVFCAPVEHAASVILDGMATLEGSRRLGSFQINQPSELRI
jgi:hypothetical protein